jgi:N-acetylneuraminate synthase/N,N'-diacetyllegionaminate synthase
MIAEIGGNHEGDFEYAQRLVSLAVNTPVDFIKFQLYTGDTLVSEIEDPNRNRHFKNFELTRADHEELIRLVVDGGKRYLCSVWDLDLIDWVDPYVDTYKVGSGDLTAYPILKRLAATAKPIMLSTGLSTMDEVADAVAYLRSLGEVYKSADHLTILQCTTMYPIADKDAHIGVMQSFRESFKTRVGYSDHTVGSRALRVAALLGADVLEFHFTDSREGKAFRDHAVSLTPDEVCELADEISKDLATVGSAEKKPLPVELDAHHIHSFRRAVYPSRDIREGEMLGDHNLTVLRPNTGIDAREYDRLVGRVALRDLRRHEAINWGDIR